MFVVFFVVPRLTVSRPAFSLWVKTQQALARDYRRDGLVDALSDAMRSEDVASGLRSTFGPSADRVSVIATRCVCFFLVASPAFLRTSFSEPPLVPRKHAKLLITRRGFSATSPTSTLAVFMPSLPAQASPRHSVTAAWKEQTNGRSAS